MESRAFIVQVDTRSVLVDQDNQRVTVFDEDGTPVFREHIQVAAGSLQGLFSALDSVQPERQA